jgi:hypothetical protein
VPVCYHIAIFNPKERKSKMSDKVYVVQEEHDGEDAPVKVYLTEDAAREHIRNCFLLFKKNLEEEDKDFIWNDFAPVTKEYEEYRWVMYSSSMPYGAFAHRFAMPQGMEDVAYVTQETSDLGGINETGLINVYASEDEAREWLRERFLAHVEVKKSDKGDYTWKEWEEDGVKCWYCGYNNDCWDVRVYAVPVVRG